MGTATGPAAHPRAEWEAVVIADPGAAQLREPSASHPVGERSRTPIPATWSACMRCAHAVVVFVLLLISNQAWAPVLSARSSLVVPTQFPTIQQAVNAARPGDTVQLRAGTYAEQVIIPNSLTLIGAGAGVSIIQAPPVLSRTPSAPPPSSRSTKVQGDHVGTDGGRAWVQFVWGG